MQKFLPVLKKCPLFAGVTEEQLLSVLACLGAAVQPYDKGAAILSEGAAAQRMGIVLSGSVQVERTDYAGNRSIMTKLGAGQLFAEAFICAGVEKMPVSVFAVENAHVLMLDAQRILYACGNACTAHTQLIYNLMRILAAKNLSCQQKIEVLSQRTTRGKLLRYLADCAQQAGDKRFSIPFDRQALADYLQVERSGLSMEISKLRSEGVLRCTKNQFEMLK